MISAMVHSIELVQLSLVKWFRGPVLWQRTSSSAASMIAARLSSFGRIWLAIWHHCTLAEVASGWANTVAMNAACGRRSCLPAWARMLPAYSIR